MGFACIQTLTTFAPMIKRVTIVVLLIGMVLHSASRLGVLSYLYQHRHDIAHSLGLIEEIPIASCTDDYHLNQGLKIVTAEQADSTLPPATWLAQEIQLFFHGGADIRFGNPTITLGNAYTIRPAESWYNSPILSIFHPPC